MDEETIVGRIRADADLLDSGSTDIDALVDRALVRGRRQRTRRRIAGAVTCLVAAGAAIAVLGVLPTGLRSGPRVVPVGPAPHVSTSSSPAQTHTPTPPPSPGRVSGTPAEVKRTLIRLLPATAAVTHASASRDLGNDGFAWEHTTDLTVHDQQGTSYVLGGIGNGTYEDGCFNLPSCTKTSLAGGGVLWITSSPKGDKSGTDLTFRYNRPGGGHIWVMERNYASGGPVTRDTLLLNKTAARRLITRPVWDTLFLG